MLNFFKKVSSISAKELEERLDKKVQLIDVREPSEFSSGHIKGARNIPLGQVPQFSGSMSSEIYVICQSGMRSKRAYKILDQKGFNVTNVAGGMMSWTGKVVK